MSRSARRVALAVLVVAALAVGLAVLVRGGGKPGPPTGSELRELAKPPVASPLATQRIYFVMTDRYANGDPANDRGGRTGGPEITGYDPTSTAYFHGGDFKGLTGTCTDPRTGLARLKDLGFTAVWITPPFGQNTVQGTSAAYHGYWIDDFTNVDPHLGTDADFASFVECAHGLGLKVFVDVVVNHTGDTIQLSSPAYSSHPYRDCQGKQFDPSRFTATETFPCLAAATMPNPPTVVLKIKHPAWLNDPLNYHDRGDLTFTGPCDEQCLEQGDFFGLDDLFTEKPNVMRGLAQIYGSWIRRYKLDGFRVDTARHVNPEFFGLWVPRILAAARQAGVKDFQIFGEVSAPDALQLSTFVRDRGLPNVLDFPLQENAVRFAAGAVDASQLAKRLTDDDYFRLPNGVDPAPSTFLGNHDMGRAAFQVASAGVGTGIDLLARVYFAYNLLYLLRGAPVVYYGDEVGMLGAGGDQAAREDMFPTKVAEWQTEQRVGWLPIGKGSSFDVREHPLETHLRDLAALRSRVPALATGWTIVRRATGSLLVVSRIDPASRRETVVAFNSGGGPLSTRIRTATPSSAWTRELGNSPTRSDARGDLTVRVDALAAVVMTADAPIPAAAPPRPTVVVLPDDQSTLWTVNARVPAGAPVSVAFAVRRGKTWERLAVDPEPPYRAFLDPAKFKPNEQVNLVAIARGLDGRTAVSKVVPFRVRSH